MSIKYVCFDIGGVANEHLTFGGAITEAKKLWNLDLSEDEFRAIMYPNHGGRDWWREFQNGKIDAETYLSAAMNAGGMEDSSENRTTFRRCLESWCGRAYTPVLDLVERLKENGYGTGVLSNNNEIMYNTPGAEIKNRVHVSLSSHNIGVSKPKREAFEKLLWVTGAEPDELVFVDDKISNIEAANKMGINGFHYRSGEISMDGAYSELITFLKEKGVRL